VEKIQDEYKSRGNKLERWLNR